LDAAAKKGKSKGEAEGGGDLIHRALREVQWGQRGKKPGRGGMGGRDPALFVKKKKARKRKGGDGGRHLKMNTKRWVGRVRTGLAQSDKKEKQNKNSSEKLGN